MLTFDFLVVGAGIAGASVAAHLAQTHSVVLADMEQRAGYHTTSRSAASYEPNYGPQPTLALTRASLSFFKDPPAGFAEAALFSPRGSLFFEAEGQSKQTETLLAKSDGLREIGLAETRELYPVLRDGYAKRCFRDDQTGDLDVDLLHRGYLRLFKHRNGSLVLSAPMQSVERKSGAWHARCGDATLTATTIINAAGAWGDEVAALCGAKPIGLLPKRRSIGLIPLPQDISFSHWPMVTDVGETWYSKPQSGKLIVSSADATPVPPHDAYADDMAIAEGIDRLMNATTVVVERIEHSWGGLRSFAPDGCPVVGFDSDVEGFFWLVGQGGYGIQTSPTLSRVAAALARHKPVPADTVDFGLDIADLKPDRFRI